MGRRRNVEVHPGRPNVVHVHVAELIVAHLAEKCGSPTESRHTNGGVRH